MLNIIKNMQKGLEETMGMASFGLHVQGQLCPLKIAIDH